MSDESGKPTQLPIPPDLFTIPFSLIEQWGEIPQNERLQFLLTRQDIDHFMIGLIRALEAQTTLERMVVEWSQGKIEDANKTLAEFRRHNVDAQNNIRQLASAIMASSLRERKHA
jgi:hypothetical protein